MRLGKLAEQHSAGVDSDKTSLSLAVADAASMVHNRAHKLDQEM